VTYWWFIASEGNGQKWFIGGDGLHSRGMPLVLIRRVTGRSIRLISAYIELIEDYSGPEYAFRFAHLGKIFEVHDLKKNNG